MARRTEDDTHIDDEEKEDEGKLYILGNTSREP
jgi:hypothetical protein